MPAPFWSWEASPLKTRRWLVQVYITSETHPVENAKQKMQVPGAVIFKRNAWIGAAATIMPGVTIGENAVVAAEAIATKDVPANTVVAGVPTKVAKTF